MQWRLFRQRFQQSAIHVRFYFIFTCLFLGEPLHKYIYIFGRLYLYNRRPFYVVNQLGPPASLTAIFETGNMTGILEKIKMGVSQEKEERQ